MITNKIETLLESGSEPVIRTKSLCRHFGEGETLVKAVNQVTISIEPGEFTAIIGPSGSGKSTLLHLLGGLDNPTSGFVELSGIKIEKMSGAQISDFRRDHIGFVFQAYNLIPVLSAEENIEYIMLLQGISSAVRRKRVKAMLDLVGLSELGSRRPGQLSGGQQQRVAVARAMASHPDIILADEPTGNLDGKTAHFVFDLLLDLAKENRSTLVLVTHDNQLASKLKFQYKLTQGKLKKI